MHLGRIGGPVGAASVLRKRLGRRARGGAGTATARSGPAERAGAAAVGGTTRICIAHAEASATFGPGGSGRDVGVTVGGEPSELFPAAAFPPRPSNSSPHPEPRRRRLNSQPQARSKHATTSTSIPAAAGLTSSKIRLEVLLSGASLKTCTWCPAPSQTHRPPPPRACAHGTCPANTPTTRVRANRHAHTSHARTLHHRIARGARPAPPLLPPLHCGPREGTEREVSVCKGGLDRRGEGGTVCGGWGVGWCCLDPQFHSHDHSGRAEALKDLFSMCNKAPNRKRCVG